MRESSDDSMSDKNAGGNVVFDIERETDAHNLPCYLIKPNSLFRLFWNFLIFFLVIYTAVIMPIRLAFLDQQDLERKKFQVIFDLSADICFIIDILINFFLIEEDVNGELITAMNEIAYRYVKSWFFVDLISSIPVSWIVLYW